MICLAENFMLGTADVIGEPLPGSAKVVRRGFARICARFRLRPSGCGSRRSRICGLGLDHDLHHDDDHDLEVD
jgi:hypothetical protein